MDLDELLDKDVFLAQDKWAFGVIEIGRKYKANEDYIKYANNFLDNLYGFNFGDVLFKPTFASETQFRLTKESALSYFISGNSKFSEDSGFALNNWEKIRFENSGIKIESNIALAMGNYYFYANGIEKKVEFTFVYKRDLNGILRIILHDSHLPYV